MGTWKFPGLYFCVYLKNFCSKTSFSIVKAPTQYLSPAPAWWLGRGLGGTQDGVGDRQSPLTHRYRLLCLSTTSVATGPGGPQKSSSVPRDSVGRSPRGAGDDRQKGSTCAT